MNAPTTTTTTTTNGNGNVVADAGWIGGSNATGGGDRNSSGYPTAPPDVGRPFRLNTTVQDDPVDFDPNRDRYQPRPLSSLPNPPSSLPGSSSSHSIDDRSASSRYPPQTTLPFFPSSSTLTSQHTTVEDEHSEAKDFLEGEFARQRLQRRQDMEDQHRRSESWDRSVEAERFRKESFFGSGIGPPVLDDDDEDDREDLESQQEHLGENFGGGEESHFRVGTVESGVPFGRLKISTSSPPTSNGLSAQHSYPQHQPSPLSATAFSASPLSAGSIGGRLPPGAGFGAPPQAQSRGGDYRGLNSYSSQGHEEGAGADLDRHNSFFGLGPGAGQGGQQQGRRKLTKPQGDGHRDSHQPGHQPNRSGSGLPSMPSSLMSPQAFPSSSSSGQQQSQQHQSRSKEPRQNDRDRHAAGGGAAGGHARGDSFFGLSASPTFASPPAPYGSLQQGASSNNLPPLSIPQHRYPNFSRPSSIGRAPASPTSPTMGEDGNENRHARSQSTTDLDGGPTSFYGLDQQVASQQTFLPSSSSGSGSGSGGIANAATGGQPGGGGRSSSPAGTASWGQDSGSGSMSASIGSRGLTRESRPESLYNEPGYVNSGSGGGAGGGAGQQPFAYGGGPSRAQSVTIVPPVSVQSGPLLDHSHLQPGAKAKLLDYTKSAFSPFDSRALS